MAFPLNSCFLTLESVYGDEGRGFGRNDPGVEVGQLVRFQVAAEDLRVEGERERPRDEVAKGLGSRELPVIMSASNGEGKIRCCKTGCVNV